MLIRELASIPYPPFDPTVFQVGPLEVRWYGLAYLAAFLLSYLILRRFAGDGRMRLSPPAVGDLMGWLVIAVIVGGRAGWWIFYHRAEGPEPWYEPVAVWHGGMSFHGGLAGVVAALVIWCRLNSVSFWNAADALAMVAPIGLCLGRIANFINAELVGRPTELPWGVVFPGDSFGRHPSQLYEALLEGVVLLLILWRAGPRPWRPEGRIAGLFLIVYGLIRFAVEFTRQPDQQVGFVLLGWVTMGQLLSTVLVLVGGVILARSGKVTRGNPLSNKGSEAVSLLG